MENLFNGVTFRLNGEPYAVEALRVREIVGGAEWKPLSVEGSAQSFIQVRGKTIPVLDLRQKFGFASIGKEGLNSFVVVQGSGSHRDQLVALWVDTVLEIVNVPPRDFHPLPDSLKGDRARFLRVMFGSEGEETYVLDLDRVLDTAVSEKRELVLENKAG